MPENAAFRGNIYRKKDDLDVWLSQRNEAPIEPELAIVDAHHHLWPPGERRYEIADMTADISGMNVVATVFIECCAGYEAAIDYDAGPNARPADYKAPVSEVGYVADLVRGDPQAEAHGVAKAIVAGGNLLIGEAAALDLLQSHAAAGQGRFRGIRQPAAWDCAIGPLAWRSPPPGLLLDERFQSGFKALGTLGLSFDAWLFSPQIPDLILLARRFPDVSIVLDHFGGIVGVGPYAKWPKESFRQWRAYVQELATCPNVTMKMGGLGMPAAGFGFHLETEAPDSVKLAQAWKPYIDTAVEAFGSARCMIGSNFPVDRQTSEYTTMWNAYKLATRDYSPEERRDLFSRTACRVYRLN